LHPTDPHDPHAADREDLRAARGGDHEAGRRLVRRHGGSMERTARSVIGRWSSAEAEDVVQDALIAALTTDATPTGDVGAWLRAIVVRKALDRARVRVRRAEDPIDDVPPGAEPAAGAPAEATVAARELLARLSPEDRAVLVLADVEGRSMAEIAGALGTTRVAAKLRASRARRRLARWAREQSGRAGRERREP